MSCTTHCVEEEAFDDIQATFTQKRFWPKTATFLCGYTFRLHKNDNENALKQKRSPKWKP